MIRPDYPGEPARDRPHTELTRAASEVGYTAAPSPAAHRKPALDNAHRSGSEKHTTYLARKARMPPTVHRRFPATWLVHPYSGTQVAASAEWLTGGPRNASYASPEGSLLRVSMRPSQRRSIRSAVADG
jgi:hypothetical protein